MINTLFDIITGLAVLAIITLLGTFIGGYIIGLLLF